MGQSTKSKTKIPNALFEFDVKSDGEVQTSSITTLCIFYVIVIGSRCGESSNGIYTRRTIFVLQAGIYTCNACVHTMRLILARNGARSTGLAQLVYSQSVNPFFYLSICSMPGFFRVHSARYAQNNEGCEE